VESALRLLANFDFSRIEIFVHEQVVLSDDFQEIYIVGRINQVSRLPTPATLIFGEHLRSPSVR